MRLRDLLDIRLVLPEAAAPDKDGLLVLLADEVVAHHNHIDRDELLSTLRRREAEVSTGIGTGVAVPHTTLASAASTILLVARTANGVPFDALDDRPVHIIFLLVGPTGAMGDHLKLLARIARLVRRRTFIAELRDASSAKEMYQLVLREDEHHD